MSTERAIFFRWVLINFGEKTQTATFSYFVWIWSMWTMHVTLCYIERVILVHCRHRTYINQLTQNFGIKPLNEMIARATTKNADRSNLMNLLMGIKNKEDLNARMPIENAMVWTIFMMIWTIIMNIKNPHCYGYNYDYWFLLSLSLSLTLCSVRSTSNSS